MATDVITLLSADHREFESLITRIESTDATSEARAEAISSLIRGLSLHAAAEEMVLYPEIREIAPNGDELADEALTEHQRIKEVLDQLDGKSPDDEGVMETVRSIAGEVSHHVEEEEGDLFAQLRRSAGEDKLQALGHQLEKAKKGAPTHPHPEAPNTPPGNMIVGAPTALVDRLRDALSR